MSNFTKLVLATFGKGIPFQRDNFHLLQSIGRKMLGNSGGSQYLFPLYIVSPSPTEYINKLNTSYFEDKCRLGSGQTPHTQFSFFFVVPDPEDVERTLRSAAVAVANLFQLNGIVLASFVVPDSGDPMTNPKLGPATSAINLVTAPAANSSIVENFVRATPLPANTPLERSLVRDIDIYRQFLTQRNGRGLWSGYRVRLQFSPSHHLLLPSYSTRNIATPRSLFNRLVFQLVFSLRPWD